MQKRQFHFHDGRTGAAIAVHVAPHSGRNQINKIDEDGTIQIYQSSASTQEADNRALLEYLSSVLGVKISQLDIIAGGSGREKLISIIDLDKETVQKRLSQYIAG